MRNMGEAINCNFVRTALRSIYQSKLSRNNTLPKGALSEIFKDYNHYFQSAASMQLSHAVITKKARQIVAAFNQRWNPKELRTTFVATFSLDKWKQLSPQEQQKHSARNCRACQESHPLLTQAFPMKCQVSCKQQKMMNAATIELPKETLSSPENCRQEVLQQLSVICENQFQMSAQEVLAHSSTSHLMETPSAAQRQQEMRKIVRETKNAIQCSMATVMGNRISWSTYDCIRKAEALVETPKRITDENEPPAKRLHGCKATKLEMEIDHVSLLEEAKTWETTHTVNWSALARKYGVVSPNGGQIIKEYLQQHNIGAASQEQRSGRALRRKRKSLPGGIPFPMRRPPAFHKEEVCKQVESGEILLGQEVVNSTCSTYTISKEDSTIVECTNTVFSRKISLLDIRKKLLRNHEELGIIRDNSDNFIDSLSDGEVKQRLEKLSEVIKEGNGLHQHLKKVCQQRFLKLWHDHSTIAGHGYLLVLVAGIFDPAFYYTSTELQQRCGKLLDVQSIVERPQLHIIGRSSSSLEEQAKFIDTRKECLQAMSSKVVSSKGVEITDIVRFFHGDGPAQHFEAGHQIGGDYCCAGCGVESIRMDDLAHSFRSLKRTLAECQHFVLQGKAWRKGGVSPLDKLHVGELKMELSLRGADVQGKKKPQQDKEFRELRQGIVNVPALLQTSPQQSLDSLFLSQYEISPCEPLHDIKGHFSNVIDESLHHLTGDILVEVKKVKDTILKKDTLRCSDYRKAMILIYLRLHELSPNSQLTQVYRTAVEISQLLYMHDDQRSPRTVLSLHNRTFLHAILCVQLFDPPKTMSKRKMFGRFFHSLCAHSPLINRIINHRSLNCEHQERMFGQLKSITKTTSNKRPQHIIINAIERMQFEERSKPADSVAIQESEVQKLARALGPMQNTIIPSAILTQASSHYQAHLERISDFVACGPCVWWKPHEEGIEFIDGCSEMDFRMEGPQLMHYRSINMADVEFHLHQQWEKCCSNIDQLPATLIREYSSNGELTSLATPLTHSTHHQSPEQQSSLQPQTPPDQLAHTDPPTLHTTSYSQPETAYNEPFHTSSQPLSNLHSPTPSQPLAQSQLVAVHSPSQLPATSQQISLHNLCQPPAHSQCHTPSSVPATSQLATLHRTPSSVPATSQLATLHTPSRPAIHPQPTTLCMYSQPPATSQLTTLHTPSRPASISQPTANPRSIHYSTTIAKLLSKIITDREQIKRFDTLRSELKAKTSHSRAKEASYKKLHQSLKDKVLLVHHNSTKAIKEWEDDFIAQKHHKPNRCDFTPSIINHCSIRDIACKVLQHEWKHT